MMPDTARKSTLVVDVTYRCNASCRYCQWGGPNPFIGQLPLSEILLPQETLNVLGAKRVVLSGGEPRLHPLLPEVLAHYGGMVDEVVVLTNGYGLDKQEVCRLIDHGASGVTVSLDSVLAKEAMLTRATPSSIHRKIVSNLQGIRCGKRDFEFGINAVVSRVTANWGSVGSILQFANGLGVDFVKFQPVFDDGYVSMNAADLMLSPSDADKLFDIGRRLSTIEHPETNPPEFWENIAGLAGGRELSSRSCGLGSWHSMLVRNNLSVCYWLGSVSFGGSGSILSWGAVAETRRSFEAAKLKCRVGFQCFCNQGLFHVWDDRVAGE